MELEKLSFRQLKEMLSKYDKNELVSTLIRREMKNKYIQHTQNIQHKQNIKTDDQIYKNKSKGIHPRVYPDMPTSIDRDKLNMGMFSRFTNEIEINKIKNNQSIIL